MPRFRAVFVAVLSGCAAVLSGCANPDTAYVTHPSGAPFDGHLRQNETVDVHVEVIHREFNGPLSVATVTLVTSNPNIVRTQPGGHGFLLTGLSPGTVTLQANPEANFDADFTVTVDPL